MFAGVGAQFFDNNGVPLAGGLIYTYIAGTNTSEATYTSSTGTIAHANPIVLNAAGRVSVGEIWLTDGVLYKFVLYTSTNVLIATYDNVSSAVPSTFPINLANTTNPALGDALVGFRQSDSSGNLTGAVGRTVHQKLQETISPQDFGAVGNGVADDTVALQNFFNAGGNLYIPEGIYLYSYLEFNTVFSLTGNGILRYNGSTPTSGNASIQINASISANALRITSSGVSESAADYIQANANDITINLLEMKADVQRNITGGSNFYGSNIFINQVIAENVARPIAFQPPTGTTDLRTNIHLGSLVADNYIRGLAFSYADNWSVGSVYVKTRWAGAVVTPGYNGVLLQVCNNWTMGELYIANAPEHSFRIGGDGDTSNFSIGQITSVNSAGCAMKFNVGVGYLTKNGQIGQLIGINTGEGSFAGNKEVVRVTRIQDITIGSITGLIWVTSCLVFQDVERLNVGEIYGENISSRVLQTRIDYDSSNGNIKDVNIGSVVAYMQNGARAAFGFSYYDGTREIGNITIENSFVTGFSHFLCTVDASNIYSGPIVINSRSLSTDPTGGVENVTNTILFQLIYTQGTSSYKGSAYNYFNAGAENILAQTQFVNGAVVTSDQKAALFLKSNITAANNTYGASLGFSRLESARRGAAVVAKQTGADIYNMGLAFLCSANSEATDNIFERMVIKHNETVWFNFQTFADNAAAISGGLIAGDTYQTATGELRIVV